jgi:hypothetical protein
MPAADGPGQELSAAQGVTSEHSEGRLARSKPGITRSVFKVVAYLE